MKVSRLGVQIKRLLEQHPHQQQIVLQNRASFGVIPHSPTSGHEFLKPRVRVPDSGSGLTGILVGWLRLGVGYLDLFPRLECDGKSPACPPHKAFCGLNMILKV